jgi:hypothetical protein
MSANTSAGSPSLPQQGSPLHAPPAPTTPVNEADLPKGQCRYILCVPGIKGSRCACTGFTLNKSVPGAHCDCGHMSCFHLKTDEAALSPDKQEVEQLKQRIQFLEQQLDRETSGGFGGIVGRVIELEERLERACEETRHEFKNVYSGVHNVWHSVRQLEERAEAAACQMESYHSRLTATESGLNQVQQRQMELDEGDMELEERLGARLEVIEGVIGLDHNASTLRGRPRRKSTSDSMSRGPTSPDSMRRRSSATRIEAVPFRQPTPVEGPWTVHVSFLPDQAQPFPFEKDTTAYKRCLSRGLHRMVVVADPSAEAFVEAIDIAFGSLLRGRPWMPLQAKLCDAKQLQGLPMLRPLDGRLQALRYDAEFLKRYCAVCDAGDKMESLYIAMRAETLSWHFLRNVPPFLDGLEGCWQHDPYLDTFDDFRDDRDRPSAADVTGLPLKRAASEMSCASTLGPAPLAADGDGSRKMPRTACISSMVDLPLRAEKV